MEIEVKNEQIINADGKDSIYTVAYIEFLTILYKYYFFRYHGFMILLQKNCNMNLSSLKPHVENILLEAQLNIDVQINNRMLNFYKAQCHITIGLGFILGMEIKKN